MSKAAPETSFLNCEALLDAAPFGLAAVGPSLCFERPISARAAALLAGADARLEGCDVADALAAGFDLGADAAARLREALDLAFDAQAPAARLTWDLNADHLPSALRRGAAGRETVVDCAWTPIFASRGGRLAHVALALRDVTQERRLEAALAAERAAQSRLQRTVEALIAQPRDALAVFFAESEARIERASSFAVARDAALAELHSLKGGARLLGFADLADALHGAESAAAAAAASAAAGPLLADAAVEAAWHGALDIYDRYRDVFFDLLGGGDAARAVSFAALAEPYLADARAAVEALGVDCVMAIEDGLGAPPPALAAALRVALQHVAPNMVDHSLAPAIAAGRRTPATLAARARREDGWAVVSLEDNGAGFDAEKIAARAAALGLAADQSDPFAVILAPGFTTLERATLRSGRGVGLGAVAAAVKAIGGRLRFENRRGGGGRTEITAPIPPA